MRIYQQKINIKSTTQIEFIDITDQVQEIVDKCGIREGQATVYAPHTTMSIVVNHNEAMLLQDFMKVIYRLAPQENQYAHDLFELKKGNKNDGRSNGHSHCKSMLLGVSETIPIEKGRLMITGRQNVFAVEFDGARERDIVVQIIGI